jgi:hypothetical protein
MNEARTTRMIDSPKPPRIPQRRAAAVIAQYIRERSTRHGGGEIRPRQPTLALKPRAWCGTDPITEVSASIHLS